MDNCGIINTRRFMSTNLSSSLNERFTQDIIGSPSYFLDGIIDWVRSNLEPEEVFEIRELESWARNNGWVEEE